MRSRLRSFLLTSALSFIPSLASATTISGLYVDGGAGYNEVQDQHVHANSPAMTADGVPIPGMAQPKFSVNHGTGFTGFGAVGWGFGNGLRVEAEGLYNFSHDSYTDYGGNNTPYFDPTNEALMKKLFPGVTVTKASCNNLTYYKSNSNGTWTVLSHLTEKEYFNTAFGQGSSSYLEPTVSNIMNGDYVPANVCYAVTAQNNDQQLIQNAYYTAENYEGKLAPGLYYDTLPGKVIEKYASTHYPNPVEQSLGMTTGRSPFEQVSHHGTDESYGGFANVIYDFDLERLFGVKSIVTPFIGGGAGYLWQRYNRPNTMIGAITGTHGGFAWQGIIGAAFDTGIRGLQITAQYRMIGQPGSFYNGSFNYGTEGGHANFDQRFNHQFIVGFRYAFQNRSVHITPPSVSKAFAASTAAAPAPVPARSYLVFFDWNQYALTSRARQIVVEAAHATSYVHTTRINVNGYTDSSAAPGPAGQKYNYALSVKRARSVEAELIRNGVPASEIVIRGYGDTNPLVPTAPNTREPQNRRVEIILHA